MEKEMECINPFKCHKQVIHKDIKANDDLNISLNSSNIVKENKSQSVIEEEKEEEECINPFKCHKKNIPKNENTNSLNVSLSSTNIIKEYKSQCFENVNVTETTASCKQMPNTHQNAFSWKSYSNNVAITNYKVYDVKTEKINSYSSQNNSMSGNNDIEKIKVLVIYIILNYF